MPCFVRGCKDFPDFSWTHSQFGEVKSCWRHVDEKRRGPDDAAVTPPREMLDITHLPAEVKERLKQFVKGDPENPGGNAVARPDPPKVDPPGGSPAAGNISPGSSVSSKRDAQLAAKIKELQQRMKNGTGRLQNQ